MKPAEDEFERALEVRLRRVEAPASLATLVMEKVAAEPRRVVALPRLNVWSGRIAAVFLLVAILIGGGIKHHRRMERVRAEQDFAKSMEITNRALEPMRRHLQLAGITLDE